MAMVSGPEAHSPPPPALMAAIMKLGEEATKAGVLVEQGGLHGSARGARVRLAGGKVAVIDGPFSEAKEVVGGYAVYNVKTKDEVIEWTRRFMEIHRENWPGWEGVAEVRQIFDPSDFAPPGGPGAV
jgi:hypothetical protein